MGRFYQAIWPTALAVVAVAGHRILQAVAADDHVGTVYADTSR
jgi:hypothetical protein